MENINELKPVQDYTIDSIPLNKDEFIKLYESVLDIFEDDTIYGVLYLSSLQFYDMMKEYSKRTISLEASLTILYFFANTGYDAFSFIPNEKIRNIIYNQPNPAITELDKALISLINLNYGALLYPTDKSEQKAKEEAYSYIFFLNNVQNYEYKTHMTLDLSSEDVMSYEFRDGFFFDLLTNPLFFDTDPRMIPISEIEINKLNEVLEYRKRLNETIVEVRKAEKEYVKNEENNNIWKQFISWMNYRSAEEINALEMINSNDTLDCKIQVFDRFLSEINDPNTNVLDSGLCLREIKKKIMERASHACNYMEIRSNDKQNHVLDEFTIHSIFSPYSFNCVLISYHVFLINSSNRNLDLLLTLLDGFIRNNLEQEDSKNESTSNHNTISERLISVSNLIIKFYETHEETIKTLQFESIQNEDTLSGQGYDSDIFRLLGIKEQEMMDETVAAINALDSDDLTDFVEDYMFALLGEESIDEVKDNLHKIIPNPFDDEDKLLEQTISNRLVVSVNAIYILVKTIEKLFEQHLIEETQHKDISRIYRRLSAIEQTIVTNSYMVPFLSCLDSEDRETIDEYRLRRGIDASKIEEKNKELRQIIEQITLFNLAKGSIQEIHSEIESGNLDIHKASEIKEDLRTKIEGYSDSVTKEFVIDLVDLESQFICETLVSNNSGTDDFMRAKLSLNKNLGNLFSRLPEKAVDTLTTAELLYSKYANPEYAEGNFDYSCISALYYQAVETMYNELFWAKYSNHLNHLPVNGDRFTKLYANKNTHYLIQGYLPTSDPSKYMSLKKTRIHDFLMMGPFSVLLEGLTSNQPTEMRFLRKYFEGIFGFDKVSKSSEEYKDFQRKVDELYRKIYEAKDKRNDASHGRHKITLEECKIDKKQVLPDLANIREEYLGLIRLFLSLYRTES